MFPPLNLPDYRKIISILQVFYNRNPLRCNGLRFFVRVLREFSLTPSRSVQYFSIQRTQYKGVEIMNETLTTAANVATTSTDSTMLVWGLLAAIVAVVGIALLSTNHGMGGRF